MHHPTKIRVEKLCRVKYVKMNMPMLYVHWLKELSSGKMDHGMIQEVLDAFL